MSAWQARRVASLVVWLAALPSAAGAGALTFVEAEKDGLNPIVALDGARAVALNPIVCTFPGPVCTGGEQVYVTGAGLVGGLVVFNRSTATGALTLVDVERAGFLGVTDLVNPRAIAISPDGKHVYVAAEGAGGALVVFSRDLATGALTFLQALADGTPGIDGLGGAQDVAISPDGAHLYTVASEDKLGVFSRNATTGLLTFVEVHSGFFNPEGVTVSPGGGHVYVADTAANEVTIFSRSASTGALTFVGVSAAFGARELRFNSTGAHLYVVGGLAGPGGGSLRVFSRNAATGLLTLVETETNGVGGVDGLAGARALALDAAGAHVYVVGDNLAVFERDALSGAVTFVQVVREGVGGVDGLDGTGGVAVSPDGAHVYGTGSADDAVAAFTRNGTSGALGFVEAERGEVDGLNGAAAVATTASSAAPTPGHVYVSGLLDDALAVFNRTGGGLGFVQVHKDGVAGVDGLNGAAGVALSPNGAHVYVAGSLDNAVAAFSRDPASGQLRFVQARQDGVGGVDGLAEALAVALSPDGAHLYAAGHTDDALAAFARNATTGALTFVEAEKDGLGGVDGLNGASAVALSPDGAHVYATGDQDNAVAVFSRSAGTGALTFVEAEKDGLAGVNGLAAAAAVAVSPDGLHVYVAGRLDNAVAVFGRDGTTGALTFLAVVQDGVAGVDGLAGARALAIGPTGADLYVAGNVDDAVAVFARDGSSGLLAFVEAERDGLGGVDGLNAAFGLAVVYEYSSGYVQAVGNLDDAVAVFGVATADLVVSEKTDGQTSAVPGTPLTYTITLQNFGPSAVTAARATDDFPSLTGLSWACAASIGSSCGAAAGAGPIDQLVDLAVNGTLTYTATGTLDPAATGLLTNTAFLFAPPDVTDWDPANSNSDTTSLVPTTDLAATITDGQTSVVPGEALTYTITVSSSGPSLAASTAVSLTFSAGTYLASPAWSCVASPGSTCTPSGVGFIIDTVTLAPGGSLTYSFSATVDPGLRGTLAQAVGVTGPGLSDPTPANNSATDTNGVTPLVDVRVSQVDTPDPSPAAGASLTYDLQVVNGGPSSATSVSLEDALPAGLNPTYLSPGCSFAAGTVTCALGTLAPGAFLPVQIVASAMPGTVGQITNTAGASSTEPDTNPSNNTSSETTTLVFVKGDFDNSLQMQADLLLRRLSDGYHQVWVMQETTQTSVSDVSPTPASLDWQVAGVDDFNDDQRNDLVLWNSASGLVEFWMMNGTTRLGAAVPISGAPTLATDWKPSATADFDHDGKPDLVWRNLVSQQIAIWTMDGAAKTGEIVPTPSAAVHANWAIVAALDFNDDANIDLLWYNSTSGKIVLWFMDAAVQRIAGQFTNPANAGNNNWNVLAAGDFGVGPAGSTGTKDIVWRNASSGRYVVWFMDFAGNRTAGLFTTPDGPPDALDWTIAGPR